MRGFRCDLAVIGCSALDAEGNLLDFDPEEVAVSRAILAQAREIWLVADATKFTRRAPVRIGGLADVARLYTDAPVPGDLAQATRVIRVSAAPEGHWAPHRAPQA